MNVTQFVSSWKSTVFKLEKQESSVAKQLKTSIEKRGKEIFSNIVVTTSIYLDKRFAFLLDSNQISAARGFIRSVWLRLKVLDGSTETERIIESIPEDDDSFELSLQELAGGSTNESSQTKDVLSKEIVAFENGPRLKTSEDIAMFWKTQTDFPLLSRIALEIISIPVTEVSVERLFSHLNFILSKHRAVMQAELVEDILFLRLNKKFANRL